MQIENVPVLGGPAPREAHRTAQKLAGFARRYLAAIQCHPAFDRYLDVGCGNGTITELVSPAFQETVGIDVEEVRLSEFQVRAADQSNFKLSLMSAAQMELASESCSLITCFEVLEHVADLVATAREIVRVCKKGGIAILSVPQVWFPFENHGARIGNRTYTRKIPLLPYIRPLHRRYALARIFSSADLNRIFLSQGMELLGTAYASPQFERAATHGSSWESKFVFLRGLLDRCEGIPVLRSLTGVSILKAYRKRL
jgi:SAM-dependent methyltransferase